jgi:hypothetical protein
MPETVENLHLPSGLDVQIPKAAPVFRLWSGEFTGDTYGNKSLLYVDGVPMFAELAILRLFQKDGGTECRSIPSGRSTVPLGERQAW